MPHYSPYTVAVKSGGGVRDTPDYNGLPNAKRHPNVKHTRRTAGKTTQLGIFEFLSTIFVANEILPIQQRMTDAEIQRKLISEFRDRAIARQLEDRRFSVNYYRSRYNKGHFTQGIIPDRIAPIPLSARDRDVLGKLVGARRNYPISFRYQLDPSDVTHTYFRVDSRTGKTPLLAIDLQVALRKAEQLKKGNKT